MKIKDFDKKFNKFWYIYLPYILTVLAIVITCIDFEIRKYDYDAGYKFKTHLSFTNFLGGNPQIVAMLGMILMIPCLIIIPKSILKTRKSGDGLGLMFMPLGLLGIFQVLSAIENKKDMEIAIVLGVVLFVISATATFKKAMPVVGKLCLAMMFVFFFCFLADFMPYCYNTYPIYDEKVSEAVTVCDIYFSNFLRDLCILGAFGVFCDRITLKYKELNTSKKK